MAIVQWILYFQKIKQFISGFVSTIFKFDKKIKCTEDIVDQIIEWWVSCQLIGW
jgi:hypothetical protein